MPVTDKVSARVQFLYGSGDDEIETINAPADLVERDRLYNGPIWRLSGHRVTGPYRTARAAGLGAFIVKEWEP